MYKHETHHYSPPVAVTGCLTVAYRWAFFPIAEFPLKTFAGFNSGSQQQLGLTFAQARGDGFGTNHCFGFRSRLLGRRQRIGQRSRSRPYQPARPFCDAFPSAVFPGPGSPARVADREIPTDTKWFDRWETPHGSIDDDTTIFLVGPQDKVRVAQTGLSTSTTTHVRNGLARLVALASVMN